MDLPVMPPILPMLARAATTVPDGGGWSYEPKWDGFRCLVFKDGDEVELTSRTAKPLTRYFPEVVTALRATLPARCVLDGELVVASGSRLDFDRLQERIHPAASRIERLSAETPAGYVAFDLLALGDASYVDAPFADRRAALEAALAGADDTTVHLCTTTRDPAVARQWLATFEGAGLDGVVAKRLESPYTPDKRTMIKVKHARTADVVVAGMRPHKTSTPERPLLGSLLLGLYDDEGLQHVGVCATFTMARRAELWAELQPLVVDGSDHPWGGGAIIANPDRTPGTQSRWSHGKDLSFVPLRPGLVLEVGYDQLDGRRFRHTARFERWRPDREPASCRYDQLEQVTGYDLSLVWGHG